MVRELSHLTKNAKPTPFHHLIATLAEEGRLLRLYSQNVDGIDTSLPPLSTNIPLNPKGPWPKTIQLHGGLEKMACTKCGVIDTFNGALFEGPEPPACPACVEHDQVRTTMGNKRSHGVGRLRPRMVLYNEFNPDQEAIGAVSAADLKARPDAVIVVGTSMKIPGLRRLAREMCWVTRGRRDGFAAWINLDPEPLGADFKDCWDLVVRAPCDDIATYAGLPKYNEKDIGEYKMATMDDVIRAKSRGDIQVKLPQIKAVENVAGMVTPTASPRHQSVTTADVKNLPKLQIKLGKSKSLTNPKKAAPAKKAKNSKKGQAAKSSNTITNSFTVTKPAKGATIKSLSEKLPKEDAPASSSPMVPDFTNLLLAKTPSKRTPLPSAKPTKDIQTPVMGLMSNGDFRANSSESALQLHDESRQYGHTNDAPEKRESSVSSGSPYSQVVYDIGKQETVSPKSVPRGLGALID